MPFLFIYSVKLWLIFSSKSEECIHNQSEFVNYVWFQVNILGIRYLYYREVNIVIRIVTLPCRYTTLVLFFICICIFRQCLRFSCKLNCRFHLSTYYNGYWVTQEELGYCFYLNLVPITVRMHDRGRHKYNIVKHRSWQIQIIFLFELTFLSYHHMLATYFFLLICWSTKI